MAVAKLAQDFTEKGWQSVAILEPSEPFHAYRYEPATKAQGGGVYIKLNADGHVQIEKGFLPQSDRRCASKRAAPESTGVRPNGDATLGEARSQPEMSVALANYIDLVRHSAVAAALVKNPKVALRVLAASLIAGSRHIDATREPILCVCSPRRMTDRFGVLNYPRLPLVEIVAEILSGGLL